MHKGKNNSNINNSLDNKLEHSGKKSSITNSLYLQNQKPKSSTILSNKKLENSDDILTYEGLSDSEKTQIDEALKSTSGSQLNVQAKMVELMHLVKGNRIDAKTLEYSKDILINGLCGGWSKVFIHYPKWVESIYNTVRTWKPTSKMNDSESSLAEFEKHMKSKTTLRGVENVIKLLRDVYNQMDELEPEAGYDALPDWTNLEISERSTSLTYNETIKNQEKTLNLRNKNAANLVCQEVKNNTISEVSGECMVHIESDLHHMALRVQKIPSKRNNSKLKLLITVVETEKTGIVKTNNWQDAETILNSWLAKEEPNLKRLTLRIKKIGF